ncbi:MAG: hypothetical protein HFE90_00630, partial [Firmicutes bacterium]|nr:hypothetical protein [Bacillota bacterium]
MFSTILHPDYSFGDVTEEESAILQAKENEFINDRTLLLQKNNDIELELYDKYNVKLGLRNKDGTGVCVGLTKVSDVYGYDKDENGKKVPAHGKLFYRGIDVEDIVTACFKENRFGFEEVTYLLLFGKLPNREELNHFNKILGARRELPRGFIRDTILVNPSKSIMNQIAKEVLALYSYDP